MTQTTEEKALETSKPRGRPKAKTSLAQSEMDRIQTQFEEYDKKIKELTLDRMNAAPKAETEDQTKLSNKEIAKSQDIYLKPLRRISGADKFNERFRDEYTTKKEYVQFIAENKEIIGEKIEMWTRPYGGVDAEFWEVPVNKPVWGPRYLAEQISRCNYHRLKMDQGIVTDTNSMGTFHGHLVVDQVVDRITAKPVMKQSKVFLGSSAF